MNNLYKGTEFIGAMLTDEELKLLVKLCEKFTLEFSDEDLESIGFTKSEIGVIHQWYYGL